MDYKEKLEEAKRLYESANADQKYVLESLFPEIRESEDEKIRKEIIIYLDWLSGRIAVIPKGRYTIKDMVKWLEKQKEPSIPDIIDIRKDIIEHFEYEIEELSSKGEEYEAEIEELSKYIAWLEKQGEQKPADKVKSKFKVGNWIVFNGLTLYVKEVVKGFYRTISKGGIPNSYDWDIDNVARLWNIKDAKDGDVLKEDSCTFIIERMKPDGTAIMHCCLFDDGDFDLGSTLSFDIDSTHPATKEQRDTLMKAMADAGYTFDFEKKELKKIEQKSADKVEPKCKESETKIYDAPTSFEDRLFAFVAACELLTLPAKIEFIKEHSQDLLDAAKEQTEKKYKEDMELIKGMLEELNKKTFKPPFDIKTFPESKPSDPFKPFDPWGQVCVYACPPTPYDPNITASTTDTLNEEE